MEAPSTLLVGKGLMELELSTEGQGTYVVIG